MPGARGRSWCKRRIVPKYHHCADTLALPGSDWPRSCCSTSSPRSSSSPTACGRRIKPLAGPPKHDRTIPGSDARNRGVYLTSNSVTVTKQPPSSEVIPGYTICMKTATSAGRRRSARASEPGMSRSGSSRRLRSYLHELDAQLLTGQIDRALESIHGTDVKGGPRRGQRIPRAVETMDDEW